MSSGSLAIMQIAQLKSTQANNDALDAAEQQRALIDKQRDTRDDGTPYQDNGDGTDTIVDFEIGYDLSVQPEIEILWDFG